MLKNVTLGTSDTELLTAPAGKTYAVLTLVFCNISTNPIQISVYASAGGVGSGTDATCILKSFTIQASDTYIWTSNEKLVLDATDRISALASSGASISALCNYLEV